MTPEASTWVGFAIAAVAMLGTCLNAITARKAARDKLEFDAKIVTLENQLGECRRQHEECKEGHEKNDARISALEARHASDSAVLRKKKGPG